jgi:hypothetical protein|nr:MAG TPA: PHOTOSYNTHETIC REACTION CENTER CYTOCHROME C, LIPIDIC-SPONGE PHASE, PHOTOSYNTHESIS, REACTION [Caudoviricetes sp.]
MRVISQDGTIDVPYDYFSLSVASGKYKDVEYACIYCHNISAPHGTRLAEYSNKEKALKAMEMLREAYAGKPILNVDELPNLTPQDFREKLWTGDILLCNKPSADVSFSNNYCFQFPKDDEVEV